MKRIKCLSALLILTFLFCVGNVNAQVKKVDAKQQKLEYKATSNAKKSSATQTSTKQGTSLKDAKVTQAQVRKTTAKSVQLQGTGKSGASTTKASSNHTKLSDAKVTQAQIRKTTAKPVQLQGTGKSGTSTTNTNSNHAKLKDSKLAPYYSAKTSPVSSTQLKGNVSTNKKATLRAKPLRKTINRPD